MKTLSADTWKDAEERQLEAYRQMSPTEKFGVVDDLNRTVRLLAEARIRARCGPQVSEHEIRLRVAALELDRDTMIRVFGWDPEVRGY